jgi:hypothetical protein
MTKQGQGLPKSLPASALPIILCLQIFDRMEEHATYSNLGTYARPKAILSPFDGRNCTIDEIFPLNIEHKSCAEGNSFLPFGTLPRGVFSLWKASKSNDACLFGPHQFVGHAAPANFARDERVHKIYEVEKRNQDC